MKLNRLTGGYVSPSPADEPQTHIGSLSGRYCSECGQAERLAKPQFSPFYDRTTGKELFESICTNTACRHGCTRVTGHKFGWLSNKCMRCGYVIHRLK